jgi:hypothetical protein
MPRLRAWIAAGGAADQPRLRLVRQRELRNALAYAAELLHGLRRKRNQLRLCRSNGDGI